MCYQQEDIFSFIVYRLPTIYRSILSRVAGINSLPPPSSIDQPQPHIRRPTQTMLSTTLLRTTGRRIISTATSQTKRTVSSSNAFKRANANEAHKLLPIITAATIVGGWGIMTMQDENNTKTAQCLFGRSDTQVREVEDKFATYWPRNIMILFGPPGALMVGGYIYFVIIV